MALERPRQRVRITNAEDVRGMIELDGVALRGVRGATLRMTARYVAWAFGEYAQGTDPVAVLRELADRLEGKA